MPYMLSLGGAFRILADEAIEWVRHSTNGERTQVMSVLPSHFPVPQQGLIDDRGRESAGTVPVIRSL